MMFFDATKDIKEKHNNPALVFLLGGLMAVLFVVMFSAPIIGDNVQTLYPYAVDEFGHAVKNAEHVGMVLFTKYLVPFEVAAVMLLVAMIAGIILAGKKMDYSLTECEATDEELHKEIKKEEA
jgi:NADH-quinone oxidoreductase subunit J